MKKSRVAALIGVAVLVIGATFTTYSDVGTFLFNRGSYVFSVERLAREATVPLACVVVLATALAVRARASKPFVLSLAVAVLAWVLCGRAVALSWDGRLAGGWFFMRTNTIHLRGEMEDMEDYAKRWHVTVLPGWRLELRSPERTERLFVGPALVKRSLTLLKEHGFQVAGS